MYRARNTVNRFNCLHLFNDMEGATVIIFDTETTGLDTETDHIVELAAKKYSIKDHRLEPIAEMDLYIRPPVRMDPKASKVNGITDEFLADKPAAAEVFPDIEEFFGEAPLLVGHNVSFDIDMMKTMYARQGKQFTPRFSFDTVEFARDILAPKDLDGYIKAHGLDKLHRYKLSTIVSYYGLEDGLSFHCAIDDVEATARFLSVCYAEYSNMEEKGKQKIYYSYFYFWEGRNKNQAGIWVRLTNGQLVYYSTYNKAWMSSSVDLSEVDINDFERTILQNCGISLKEFGKLTQKKWDILKEKRRREGVII